MVGQCLPTQACAHVSDRPSRPRQPPPLPLWELSACGLLPSWEFGNCVSTRAVAMDQGKPTRMLNGSLVFGVAELIMIHYCVSVPSLAARRPGSCCTNS